MGRPVHFEIHAADPDRTVEFYRELFGWSINRWGDAEYWLVGTGDGPGIDGAIVPRRSEPPTPGQPVNAFVVTVQVDDLDGTTAAAERLGGAVVVARTPVPGIGWTAYLTDPDGAIVGLLQSDPSAA